MCVLFSLNSFWLFFGNSNVFEKATRVLFPFVNFNIFGADYTKNGIERTHKERHFKLGDDDRETQNSLHLFVVHACVCVCSQQTHVLLSQCIPKSIHLFLARSFRYNTHSICFSSIYFHLDASNFLILNYCRLFARSRFFRFFLLVFAKPKLQKKNSCLHKHQK